MSTFYLLPSRPVLGERFANLLRTLFPGLDWSSGDWTRLAESVCLAAVHQPDVFVVYGEDFPDDEDAVTVLTDVYGAEAGDEVIEISMGDRPGESTSRRWRIGGKVQQKVLAAAG